MFDLLFSIKTGEVHVLFASVYRYQCVVISSSWSSQILANLDIQQFILIITTIMECFYSRCLKTNTHTMNIILSEMAIIGVVKRWITIQWNHYPASGSTVATVYILFMVTRMGVKVLTHLARSFFMHFLHGMTIQH